MKVDWGVNDNQFLLHLYVGWWRTENNYKNRCFLDFNFYFTTTKVIMRTKNEKCENKKST